MDRLLSSPVAPGGLIIFSVNLAPMSNADAFTIWLDRVDEGLQIARKDGSPESHRALVETVKVLADVVRQMARKMDEDK
jgi:hypothetical protein